MNKYFLIIFAIAIFTLGFVSGMMCQQIAIRTMAVMVASNLEGVEINIDINETQIVDRTMELMIPFLNESVNENDTFEGKDAQ